MTPSLKWRKLLSFGYLSFLLLWLLVTWGELVRLGQVNELFFLRLNDSPYISDFVNHYKAAIMVWTPHRYQVYDPSVQLAWINYVIRPEHLDQVFYWQYPPYVYAMLAPLAFVSLTYAYGIWCASAVVWGCFTLYFLLRNQGSLSGRQIVLFLVGTMAAMPAWLTLRLGQFSFLLLGLTALFILCWCSRRDAYAGVVLAVTTIKLQFIPFFLVPVLVCKRWKVLAYFVVGELSLVLLAGFTVGWDNVWGYPRVLLGAETTSNFAGVSEQEMVNIRGMLSLLMPGVSTMLASCVALFVGIMMTGWLWLKVCRGNSNNIAWAMSTTVLVCLLASPHVHRQDLLLLAIPAALTLPVVSFFDLSKIGPTIFRLWCGVFLAYPLLGWVAFLFKDIFGYLRIQPLGLLNLVLLTLGVVCAIKNRRPSP